MATINDPDVGSNIAKVGAVAAKGVHTVPKPHDHGTGGHFRASVRFAIANVQVAAARLWQVRNPDPAMLIVPTRLEVRWLQIGNHTAAIRDSLQLFKLTGFTAVDTTNTVTPGITKKRTAGMAASIAALRHVTIAGAAAGMTGGTLVKDGVAAANLEQWLLAAIPTAGVVMPLIKEMLDDVNGTHPFVLAQNEGLGIENEVLLGAAAASSVVVDFSWLEVPAF